MAWLADMLWRRGHRRAPPNQQRIHGQFKHHGAAAATCTCLSVHTIVEQPNQEGDTLLNLVALIGLPAESVYGGDIQSIITDH